MQKYKSVVIVEKTTCIHIVWLAVHANKNRFILKQSQKMQCEQNNCSKFKSKCFLKVMNTRERCKVNTNKGRPHSGVACFEGQHVSYRFLKWSFKRRFPSQVCSSLFLDAEQRFCQVFHRRMCCKISVLPACPHIVSAADSQSG